MSTIAQYAEDALIGQLSSAINDSFATPTFTVNFYDKNTGIARVPNAKTQLIAIDRDTETYEKFYVSMSTTNGVTTCTTIARGLPLAYSLTPLTADSANYKPHYNPTEVSVVDTATYLNIDALLLNGEVPMNNTLDMGSHKIVKVSTPTVSTDAANKAYVDGVAIAGAPDASTTVKGIGKVSTAPVSAVNPIFVGDNDTRVPTQSENDALVGTNGTPSTSNKFVTDSDPRLSPITGLINLWSTNSAPAGWLICDGTAVSRTTYAALFAVVSTSYGVGDGSTTFNIPNLKGRVAVGRDSVDANFDILGNSPTTYVGEKTHLLTSAESGVPAHTHGLTIPTGTAPSVGFVTQGGTFNNNLTYTTGNNTPANASSAHNNIQPYTVLNYIIKT